MSVRLAERRGMPRNYAVSLLQRHARATRQTPIASNFRRIQFRTQAQFVSQLDPPGIGHRIELAPQLRGNSGFRFHFILQVERPARPFFEIRLRAREILFRFIQLFLNAIPPDAPLRQIMVEKVYLPAASFEP